MAQYIKVQPQSQSLNFTTGKLYSNFVLEIMDKSNKTNMVQIMSHICRKNISKGGQWLCCIYFLQIIDENTTFQS